VYNLEDSIKFGLAKIKNDFVEFVFFHFRRFIMKIVDEKVNALPYANARHPLSRGEMLSCCEDYGMANEDGVIDKFKTMYTDLTAGIDWGKGDTASGTSYSVLTIGGYLKAKYRVLFIKRYVGRLSDPLIQIKDMVRIIKKFNVKLTLADTGDGRVANALMVDALTALNFSEILEHGTIKEKIKWDGDLGHYIMNRTRLMTDIMMRIKRKEVSFFRANEFEPFMQDFTGIYQEYSEQTRMMRYDHVVPDDCFHSFMFWFIANMIVRGEFDKYLIGG
jgi:hypothetical protein